MGLMSKQMHAKSRTKSGGNGKKKIKFRTRKRSEMGSHFSATNMARQTWWSRSRQRAAEQD